MSIASWIMLGAHVVLFLVLRWTITKKKKALQRENSKLVLENAQLKTINESLKASFLKS